MKHARHLRLGLAVFSALAAFAAAAPAGAATITVNSIADVAADDGQCTLREAINSSNANAASGTALGECGAGSSGADTIHFNIGSGTPTISLTSALPGIVEAVTIDGNTGGATRVELNGAAAGTANGLFLDGHGNTIQNLVINRFTGNGITLNTSNNNVIQANYIGTSADGSTTAGFGNTRSGILVFVSRLNTIGGTTGTTPGGSCTGVCNLVSGNGRDGIEFDGSGQGGAGSNVVQGNFIGTDVTGTLDRGNSAAGISSVNPTSNNLIGGTNAAARNVISGNNTGGIYINGATSNGTTIQGNYIGVNTTGDAKIANGYGIRFFAAPTNLTIGGTTAGAGNIISGNNTAGIYQAASNFGALNNSRIQGNFIGTDVTGTLDLGNGAGDSSSLNARGGIALTNGASNNTISGNVVAFNTGAGVRLGSANSGGTPAAGAGNSIRGNAIYLNNGLGISHGDGGGIRSTPLANDALDSDTGANNRQNYPELTSASEAAGTITVTGTLNSLANTTFTIDFYASENSDSSGNGEGESYLGAQSVTTDANGDASISFSYAAIPGSPFTTATATNAATNDTSEFSNAFLLAENPGTFVFSSTSYSIVESTGVATITINRANGSTGSACVTYGTSDGTANAGSDYTAAAGTICFAEGETSATFEVTIGNESTPETNETVQLSLSNPTGGGALGFRSSATLTIINDDSFVTHVVNNPADTDDGACTALGTGNGCTLREAISAANSTAGQDSIHFDLGSGTPTITVRAALPEITAPVIIDGNTSGATRVEINGNNVAATGLTVSSTASRSMIRRLVINRFNGSGINLTTSSNNVIEGNFIGTNSAGTADLGNAGTGIIFNGASDNLIGGTAGTTPGGSCTGACNLISGNNGNGISADAQGRTANANVIQGNFIGTDVTGTADLGNSGRGITFLNAVHNTLIGGAAPGARNVISGNGDIGVFFSASGTHGNIVQGNHIGVNTTATAKIGNPVGVVLFFTATGNSIIGNVVGGNFKRGIELSTNGSPPNSPPHNNVVRGNFVGTDPSGTLDLGNGTAGITVEAVGGIVLLQGAYNNQIGGKNAGEGNVVAFNYGAGIRLGANSSYASAGGGNTLVNNSVYSNNGLGIALGAGTGVLNTPLTNDTADHDIGPNNLQNHPVLTGATSAGGTVTVTGSLNSVPNAAFRIEFFVSANPDASGHGEGQTFVGATDVTTDANGDAAISFGYAPVFGQTLISATATYKAGGDTSEFSVRVTDPTPQSLPPVVTATDAAGNVNQAITVSATFTDSDGIAPYSATIDCGNSTQASDVIVAAPGTSPGNVSGTCTYAAAGTYTATVTVVDNAGVPGTDTASVGVNAAPTATSGSLTTDEDTAANGTLTGSDSENSTLAFEIVDSPTVGAISNFDASAGTFTYTPAANANGSDSFTFRVTDGAATSGVATISITVNAVNDAPTAKAGSLTTDEDAEVYGTLSGSDIEGSTLSYELVSTPAKGAISEFNSATGSFTYTPNTNANGSDSFTFRASDGPADSTPATISVTVNAVNDAPTVADRSDDVDEDGSRAITLFGSDVDGDSLTFTVVSGPANGTLSGSGANLTYTPNPNFSGFDSFTYKANDGTADSNVATVDFDVAPANDAPSATAQDASTDEDTAQAVKLSGSDVEGDTLTFNVLTQPANGTLSGTPPDVTYTPNANFNGTDSFTFKVNDGQVDSTASTVAITVNAINDAPVANAQSVTLDEDSSTSITLGGSDIENDTLTFSVVSQPTNGTLSGTGANLTYTPNANYSGPDSFTFKANDGQADSSVATVSITVTDVTEPTPTPTPTPTATPTASPSPSATPSPSASPSPTPNATPGRAINISTRLRVGTDENAMIGGFIITGAAPKKVIVRGIGPSLAQENVSGPLADPVLALHGPDSSLITANDNWKQTQQSAIEQSQLAPKNDLESAIVATLQPGAYTAIVTGRGDTTGAALVEVYDLDSPAASGISNISTRGQVQPGGGFMIGGFMLDVDNSGSEVVVRALGPSLTQDGITQPLADPTLDLRDANGERLIFNDDWSDDAIDAAALTSLGLAPTGATESAIAVSLPPGAYTAIVASADNTPGVALVEVYVVK